MERIINFYRALISEQYTHYLPVQLYYIFGGGVFTIQPATFKERFVSLIEQLGKALSCSDSITTRHVETLKLNRSRRGVLDESVKAVMLSKNKTALNDLATNATRQIFRERDYLKQEEFIFTLQSQTINPILSLLLEMIRG